MENRLPRFGECEGTYLTMQPADHTGACWATLSVEHPAGNTPTTLPT